MCHFKYCWPITPSLILNQFVICMMFLEAVLMKSYCRMILFIVPIVFDRYHPDKNVSNPEASELFKEVAYSYSILSDPEKRRQYDTSGFEVCSLVESARLISTSISLFCIFCYHYNACAFRQLFCSIRSFIKYSLDAKIPVWLLYFNLQYVKVVTFY